MTAQPEETLEDILRTLVWNLEWSDKEYDLAKALDRINTYINKVADEVIGPDEPEDWKDTEKYRNALRKEQRKVKDSLLGKGK